MEFQERIINKPASVGKYELIAIVGIYDTPMRVPHSLRPDYNKVELAVNEVTEKVQVYVSADSKKELGLFKKDYPDAVIQEDATLESPEEWKRLAFSNEHIVDSATPLDTYFQVITKQSLLNRRNK